MTEQKIDGDNTEEAPQGQVGDTAAESEETEEETEGQPEAAEPEASEG